MFILILSLFLFVSYLPLVFEQEEYSLSIKTYLDPSGDISKATYYYQVARGLEWISPPFADLITEQEGEEE